MRARLAPLLLLALLATPAAADIYQWTDDIQMWKGWPTAKQGDAWYDPPYAPH